MEENENREFYIIRTVPNKEDKFIDEIERVINNKNYEGVYSIFKPELVKGYIFAEAESLNKVVDLVRTLPSNRGVIREPVDFKELEKYFEKDGETVVVNERDIVEIIAGPFKGDKAKVVRLVPGKDEVVIEPLNVPVPIPITLSIEDIRVIKENKTEN